MVRSLILSCVLLRLSRGLLQERRNARRSLNGGFVEESHYIEGLVHAEHVGYEWFHQLDVGWNCSMTLEKLIWSRLGRFGELWSESGDNYALGAPWPPL